MGEQLLAHLVRVRARARARVSVWARARLGFGLGLGLELGLGLGLGLGLELELSERLLVHMLQPRHRVLFGHEDTGQRGAPVEHPRPSRGGPALLSPVLTAHLDARRLEARVGVSR